MIFITDVNWQEFPDSSFSERDLNVLNLIGEEDLTSFTFDGLKRRLGVHSETLSRILGRLEGQGLVEKQPDGYRVMRRVKDSTSPFPYSVEKPQMSIMQTMLSPEIPVQQVISDLSGRWFGVLRWLGYSENKAAITLKWITEDGGVQVNAVFSDNHLSIEAKLLHEKNLNVALKASYQLMEHIAGFYSGRRRVSHVAYLGNSQPFLLFT